MHALLEKNTFLIKEHVGILKAANNFDIYNPDNGEMIMHCREEHLGMITKILRFTDYKRMTPFDIEVRTPQGAKILNLKRGISIFLSDVDVLDETDRVIGGFKQKLLSIGGKFDVLDSLGTNLCTLQGNWVGWEFNFIKDDSVLATVTKKWAGLGKELLTSADNYVLSISPQVSAKNPLRPLILASVLCIDMVLKE